MTSGPRISRIGLLLAALFAAGAHSPAAAQVAGAAAPVAPSDLPCSARQDVLGVSRVIEIDTTGGPRYGRPDPESLLQAGEVILTFDDGPMKRYTVPILDALDAECTLATFFIVGRMALADPTTLREVARRGHTIGTHSWSHKRLDLIGAAKAKEEIELGQSAIALALGAPVAPFFRFPYLGESAAMRAHLKSRNVANFSIDVDSRDFLTRNPAVVRRNVMGQLAKTGKGIILFHDIQPSTAGALTSLLDELKAGGYKVVHVVSKQPATLLPEYDAMAEREAQRRKLALTQQPLADRSVVWPVTGGAVGAGVEVLPWAATTRPASTAAQSTTPHHALPAQPPRPRLRPQIDDDSWAIRPLGP
jgi:peptidoglycan/xylan/chitin deacetylase (PgdA/CDA1 family)